MALQRSSFLSLVAICLVLQPSATFLIPASLIPCQGRIPDARPLQQLPVEHGSSSSMYPSARRRRQPFLQAAAAGGGEEGTATATAPVSITTTRGDGYFTSSPARDRARRIIIEGEALGFEEKVLEGGRGFENRLLEVMKERTKELVGWVSFHEDRGKSLEFLDIEIIPPQYKGKGVGRRLIYGAFERFLNKGGRISQVITRSPPAAIGFFEAMGLVQASDGNEEEEGRREDDDRVLMRGDLSRALDKVGHYANSLPQGQESSLVYNILGRLQHDNKSFTEAGELYTKALGLSPNDSAIFQNLGGAFASNGEHQLAFASFQRAIDLCPDDRYTYFKLGMMYEQLATGKFKEAAEHSLKCYEFYIDGEEGRLDTDAMTMYGNLLLKRLCPEEAIDVYRKALEVNGALYNVWFNMANAYLRLGKRQEAVDALRKTLHLNPNVTAARHLLLSTTEEGRLDATTADPAYVLELFDYYAPMYDQHMKEGLRYTAPRILRQEVRKVFNRTLHEEEGGTVEVLRALNKSLRILDLGCGTGLCGAWFTDYSTRMVGVDISPKMIEQAKKKMVYDDLHVSDLREWVAEQVTQQSDQPFDLVISADVLQYLGQLEGILADVASILHPRRALMAFTLEELQADYGQAAADGGRAARGFLLGPTGRFLHTKAYVERCLAQAGLVVETAISYSPRQERGEPVPGFLYVVRRKRDGQI